ncbi:MAG: Nudix family hydrolase [Gammaproteobacteria bacterium]|nr:Nudix family hydrolase [Gammaproteobacteria bacterium]
MSTAPQHSAATPRLRVAAAAIRRHDGAILLSVRPAHTAHGGLWEFPGGKLEARERPVDGLARELVEELGIHIERATPLITVRHVYPKAEVELIVFEVRDWQGEPHGREGQHVEWVDISKLSALQFPAANLPVTTAVTLPRVMMVTPDLGADEDAFLTRLEACLAAGVELVQLRIRALGEQRRRVVTAALAACARHHARLMLNGSAQDAVALGAHGVHLNRQRLFECEARPVAATMLLSAACHDARELAQAERIGVDFVYLSPVLATTSHAGAETLGWPRLRALCTATRLPVYALGGMTPPQLPRAVRAGCQGIAMLSGLWEHAAPAALLERAAKELAKAARHIKPG